MLVKTEALILKTIKYRETSLIVKAYTESHGLLSFIINGVRTAKNANKAVLFQSLNFLDVIIYYKENKSLLHLKEYKFNFLYQEIPFNIIKSSIAIFMLEIVEHILKEQEENTDLYHFLKNELLGLDSETGNVANFHLYFLGALTGFMGIAAQGNFSEKTPYFNLHEGRFSQQKDTYHSIEGKPCQIFSNLVQKQSLSLSKTERKEMLNIFLDYFKIHIAGFKPINSISVLETVLS